MTTNEPEDPILSPLVLSDSTTNWFYFLSGICLLIGTLSTIIVKYKLHLPIKQWLSPLIQPKTPKDSPPLWQNNFETMEESSPLWETWEQERPPLPKDLLKV